MLYDCNLVSEKLKSWRRYLDDYRLPDWDDIPDIGLYMEQVLILLKDYLDFLPPELKEEQFITAATINNYVNKGFMPKPEKKKYYRVHIAYMIMICTLKRVLSISTVQKLIPMGLTEEQVRGIYTKYAERHKMAANYFIEQLKIIAGPMLYSTDPEHEVAVDGTEDLITVTAVIGALSQLITEKLILLEGRTEGKTE